MSTSLYNDFIGVSANTSGDTLFRSSYVSVVYNNSDNANPSISVDISTMTGKIGPLTGGSGEDSTITFHIYVSTTKPTVSTWGNPRSLVHHSTVNLISGSVNEKGYYTYIRADNNNDSISVKVNLSPSTTYYIWFYVYYYDAIGHVPDWSMHYGLPVSAVGSTGTYNFQPIQFTTDRYIPPEPPTPGGGDDNVANITYLDASRSGDSVYVSYSTNMTCTLYLDFYRNGSSSSAYSTSVSASTSRSSYTYTGSSRGNYYTVRARAYYGGSYTDTQSTNAVYLLPVAPTVTATLDATNKKAANVRVGLNGQYHDSALTTAIEMREQATGGGWGDWSVVSESSKNSSSTQDYTVDISKVTQFRVCYGWHGSYGDYTVAVGSVSPYSYPEVGDFAGVYLFDDEIVSSTQCKLRIRHAQQGELSPRSGYRVYIDGNQVSSEGAGIDGQTEDFGPFEFPSKVGKTYSLGIVAFGDGGESPLVQTVMYGRAAPPPSISLSRGFNSRYGYWTSAQCDGSLTNDYPVRTTVSMGKAGAPSVPLVASQSSSYTVEFNKETKGYEASYSVGEMNASAVCVPVGVELSPATRWYSEPVTAKVVPQGYEIPEGTLSVDLRGVVDEETKVGTYAVTWDEAVYGGEELASLYEVIVYESDGYTERSRTSVDSHRSTGLAKGQQYTYTFDGPFGSCVRVTPNLNGYSGRESFYAADAEGLTFIGPVIVDAWVDGFTGHVVFTPARGGIPRTEPSGGKSYRYRVYLGTSRTRSKPDDEVFTVRGDRTIEYTFGIYTPYPARVTVSAIDENGNESPRSNSLLVQRFFVQRDVEGVGAYAFSSELTLRDVGIYGFGYSLMTNGSTVHIQDSDVRVPEGGRLYIVEGDDDVIVETAVTYELET